MNGKIMKKTVTSIIAILLVAVLAIALASFLNKPMTAKAAGNVFSATYAGTHGQLTDVEGGHRTDEQEVAYLNVDSSKILKITTGEQLYNFINGESNYTHAYLANDVGIAYANGTGAGSGYDFTTDKVSSSAIFTKFLDGNGYTVNIWAGTGQYEYYTDTNDTYFTFGATSYRYTGMLMAINKGTVENFTIKYRSSHGAITATTGIYWSGGWQGNKSMETDTDCIYSPAGSNNNTVAGVVAGMNGDGGVIDNVRLNLNNNFKVLNKLSEKGSNDLIYNMAFVGGLVGRLGRGSSMLNSQIDIAENAGVYCGVAGSADGTWVLTDNMASLAIAGGLIGKIDQGAMEGDVMKNAIVQYSAVTGSGIVKAIANKAKGKNSYYRAYSGGAIGACLNIAAAVDGVQDGGKESGTKHIVNQGQVNGIVSSWTGMSQNNYENANNTSYGQLFGSVGENIGSCAVLYDLIDFRASNHVDTTNEANCSLDSFRSNVLLSWVGIYPKTEGGEVVVRLNNESSNRYDLRIHAFANGSAMDDEKLLADDIGNTDGKQYTLSNGERGNIIWLATLGSTERISLMRSMPTYAESKLITSSTTGNYEYSFGSMTTISLENTNGERLTREYQGKNATLNRPRVVAASGITLEEYKDNEWQILRNGVATSSDMSGTALPGTYTMTVQAEENTYIDLGYYSDNQRIAAWSPTRYTFRITEGVLEYGSGTLVSETWSNYADFELLMGSENDFESVRYVRNGSIVMDSADKFSKIGNRATIRIEESTGKNGMAYSFIAYVKDGDNDIIVARTKSSEDKLVKIDNEKPEISDISYFVRDSQGHDTPISESELSTWRKDRIVVRYNITDTKSGIKFAPSSQSNPQIKNILQEDGSYDVEVILTKNQTYTINYTDNMGNVQPVELQANVDYMLAEPTLSLSKLTYLTSDYGYSTQGATIRFNPTVGCSDWQLQYSWQKNPDGSDKWEDAMAQDVNGMNTDSPYIINSMGEKSFLVNWNMGDPVRSISAPFKMRMVNVQGLYQDVYFSRSGIVTDNGLVGSFIINYKVASLYIDYSLKSVYVFGGNYDGRSIADIIANENITDLEKFFNKVYDGNDSYVGASTFYINVDFGAEQRENIMQYADEKGIGVLYTPAYIAYPEDISIRIKVELKYESSNAADSVKLYATFAADEAITERYNLYFADNSKIDFENAYTIVGDNVTSSVCAIPMNTKINKYVYQIQLEYVMGLSNVYKYGETIPETIDVNVGIKDEPVTVKLDCLVKTIQPVSETGYWCNGEVISDLGGNMELSVKGKLIYIEALPVSVDIKMDGSYNIPTSVNAGASHVFTATYVDINGNTQNADVELSMGDETVTNSAIYKTGEYTIVVSISDKNYSVKDTYIENGKIVDDPTYKFYFYIRQGKLPLAMGINVVEYNAGRGIDYDPGIPSNLNESLFSKADLQYTYYPYFAGSEYDTNTRTIKGDYDRLNPIDGVPNRIGLYHVEVSYAGNSAFFKETYSGDLVIIKATTEFVFKNSVVYAYDVDDNKNPIHRAFNFVDAQAYVRAVNGSAEEIWSYAMIDSSKITIEYLNSNKGAWEPIGDSGYGAGWYTEVGEYTYRIKYAGDENYEECTANVIMTITKAVFKGISFEGVDGTYDGSDFVAKLDPKVPYAEAKVEFRYNGQDYKNLSDIKITNAGTHRIYMTVTQEGFQDYQVTATVTIANAKIVGVTAVPVAAVYDGTQHKVTFNGLDIIGGNYYYDGKPVTITSLTTSEAGNLYAINAGNYNGRVRLTVANHDTLELDTFIQIDKAEIVVSEAGIDLPTRIPSGLPVEGNYGYYTADGENTACFLVYKDANGNVVEPNSDGVLPDGEYTVELNVGDNHFINKHWNLIVGEINKSELSTMGIVAVSVTAAVMIAAIVTSVVIVNKRKKEDEVIA
ncbi:MAG: hypothetical protein K2O95_00500 [Clostridia bacterium]|nr:hypothetical protein [Clostridia bacterium]